MYSEKGIDLLFLFKVEATLSAGPSGQGQSSRFLSELVDSSNVKQLLPLREEKRDEIYSLIIIKLYLFLHLF